jgi:hypothetical protein
LPRTGSTDEKKYVVDTPVNPQYFLFLNEFLKDEDLVFVARVVKENGEEMRVEYFPQSTDQVQMMMWTNWQFDPRAIMYQQQRFSKKKLDQSQHRGPKD